MVDTQTLYLVLLAACILLTAFFTSSETAFFSLQKLRLEQMVGAEVKGAARVSRLIQRPDRLLSIILLGTNLMMTAASALATALALSAWGERGILIASVGLTVVLLVFAETTPKAMGHRHAERLSLTYVRPIEALSWLFSPFVFALSWIAFSITRLVGGTPVPRSLVSEEEIRTMISLGHLEGTVEKAEAEMLHKVFDFGDRAAREVMVPRTEVVWVEKGTKLGDFLKLYAEAPLSRFPVYENYRDNVVGILSIKDVLMAKARDTFKEEDTIDDLIRRAYFSPESKRIAELFAEMRDENCHMAVIVDEHGGTAGVVTLSQLLEEIVGPVGEELARAGRDYEVVNDYTFQIDGSMRIEEANQEMGLELPVSKEYETVAGFVLHRLGHIPRVGEGLRYRGLNITVTEMRGVKIERVLLTRSRERGKDAAPEG